MLNKIIIILTTSAQHFECINNIWQRKSVKVLCKLSSVVREETMDYTDSALDASYQLHPTSLFYVVIVGSGKVRV